MDLLDDAIYYAAQRATELGSDGAEYITAVYKNPDGTFGFMDPQGGHSDRKVKAKLRYPKNAVLAALVHNHPEVRSARERDQAANQFSLDDIDQARQLGIPSYITYGKDMSMLQFDPAKDRPQMPRPFTHIPEVQPAGQRIEPKPEHLISALREVNQ
jgi:hypothetical protein